MSANGKPRMAQIIHGMGIGGMERVTVDLCRNLRDRYDIAVYCTHMLGPLTRELDALGIPAVHDPVRRRSDHWFRPVKIWQFVRRFKPAVVHTQHAAAFLDSALAVRLARVPVLVHTDHSKWYPEKKRHMVAERWLSRLCDAFCAVSEHTKNDLAKWEKIPSSKITVVYNGFDFENLPGPAERAELRAFLNVPDGAPLIGSVARLQWQKGHDLLLDAMKLVLETRPDAHCVIVGGGAKEEELRQQVARLGLGHRVTLTGWRNDAVRFLAAIDVFVMSSNFEGMPVSLLEAMAVGLPVVSTSVGGVPEVVADGRTGILVDGREPRTYADALLRMIEDPARMQAFGAAGRQLYRDRFRVNGMVEAYDKIYREALDRHRNGAN